MIDRVELVEEVQQQVVPIAGGDDLVLLLVEAISESGRCRLVDDAFHIEAGDAASILGGLLLGCVKTQSRLKKTGWHNT